MTYHPVAGGETPGSLTFHLRPMQVEDIDQVREIDRLSFSLPWPANAYRYELNENPASLLWVAEMHSADGSRKLVGMVVVWLILDEAHIATIAVHPEVRGKGIGQNLLRIALEESIARGASLSTLEVRASNQTAQRLYQRFGFQVVGRRYRYYQDNQEDALIMTVDSLGEKYLARLKTLSH